VGEVSLSGPAAELAATDDVQRLYLGDGSTTAVAVPTGATLSRWQG
ncbi:MAG: hypothetical protein JWN55_2736, partial [Frankiales bacterium]|nr:hypothetical protein [Frankiales bacterium]